MSKYLPKSTKKLYIFKLFSEYAANPLIFKQLQKKKETLNSNVFLFNVLYRLAGCNYVYDFIVLFKFERNLTKSF